MTTPTPGMLRHFAARARHDAQDYRIMAHNASDALRKRYYDKCANDREDDAEFYEMKAARGEITTEYHVNTFAEAAE